MADKPTKKPLWATTGDKTEPDLSKKQTGWEYLEKPPYEWFNWLLNLIYRWIDWLEETISPLPGSISDNASDIDDLQSNNQNVVETANLTYDASDTDQVLEALQSKKIIPMPQYQRIINCKPRRDDIEHEDSGIYITNCQCRSADDTVNIIYDPEVGGFSKYALQKDGSGLNEWTEGNGNGGFADNHQPASEEDFIAYIHVLYNPNNGNIDFGFDTTVEGLRISSDSNVQSAGYTVTRCIGFIRVKYNALGSNKYWVMPFNQINNKIYYGDSTRVFNDTVASESWTNITLSDVPQDANFKAILSCYISTDASIYYAQFNNDGSLHEGIGIELSSNYVSANCYLEGGNIQLRNDGASAFVTINPLYCDISILEFW